MAATLENALGVEAKLIRGDRGAFEVSCNGDLVFSKLAEGRFPSDEEILAALQNS